MASLNFDANNVAPNLAFDPLPPGWYVAMIDESEMKPTKDGTGAYLQIRLNILDPNYANRKVFDRLNLQNSNQVAVNIAQATLSAICHATGKLQVMDSTELHGIPLEVKLSVRNADANYNATNEVKGYRAVGAGNTGAAAVQPSFSAAAPASAPAPAYAAAPTAAPAPAYAPAAPAPAPAPAAVAAPAAAPAPAAPAPAPAPAPQDLPPEMAAPQAAPVAPTAPAAPVAPTAPAAPQTQVTTNAPITPPWAL